MRNPSRSKVGAVIRALKRRPVPPLHGQPRVYHGLFLPARGGLPPELDGVALLDAEMLLRAPND
jgi:hypothetical protein